MHVLLFVALLSAGASRPWLDEAKEQMARLEFAQALSRLELARQAPSLEPTVVREVDELRAYCLVALGRWKEAEALWSAILKADPMAVPEPTYSSPKVMRVYEQAKKALFPKTAITLEPMSTSDSLVRLRVVDPWVLVTVVLLMIRTADGWREVAMARDGAFASVELPGSERLEYYVEARGAEGVLARWGRATEPHVREGVRALQKPSPPAPEAPASPANDGRQRTTVQQILGIAILGAGLVATGIATWLAITGHQLRLSARDSSKPPGDFASTAIAADQQGMLRQTWAIGLFIGSGVAGVGGSLLLVW